MFDVNNLVNGDILYYIGTGEKITFLEIFVDKDGEWRGKVQDDNGKITKYHISHFTRNRIFTQDKSEINNKSWLRASQQDDGLCWTNGCEVKVGYKRYCKDCQVDRKKHFKLQHYIKMGWDTSKLKEA